MPRHCISQSRRSCARVPTAVAAVLIALWLPVCAVAADPVKPDPQAMAVIHDLGLKQSPVASRDQPGWQPLRHVVVASRDAAVVQRLQATVPGAEVVAMARSGPARAAQLAQAQVVIGACDADTVAAAKSLHWIQTWWVGVERCVAVPGLVERGIVMANTQRTSSIPIAEHAVAMMLALSRRLPQYARSQQAGQWHYDADAPEPRELTGGTVLVVGLGGIGTEIARRAHGIGMHVVATRNSSREGPDFVDKVGLSDEMLALAADADVVINAAPLTPATTGLFDKRFFDTLKPGATFINIARGKSVVTDDLVAALRSGHLAGAGLDVTDPEPLPDGHPLWAMDNVIITPHMASDSDAQSARYLLLVAENLRRYAAGDPLLNVVDIERGY